MDDAERVRISIEVFGLFARIVHRTAQDAAAVLRADGLNPAQFQLLRAVRDQPGLTQAGLVAQRGVTPGGVSQLVSKLAASGLVRREANGSANRLWLTDAGRALVDRLIPAQDAFFAMRFGGLQPAELHRLRDLAARVLDQLPEEG